MRPGALGRLLAAAALLAVRSAHATTPRCGEAAELIARAQTIDEQAPCGTECLRQRIYFYRRAATLCPTSAAAHAGLGDLHAASGRLAEAAASFRRALQLVPGLPAALAGLGDVAVVEGRYADAIALYERALAAAPAAVRSACGLDVAHRLAANGVVDRTLVARCAAAPNVHGRGADPVAVPAARLAGRVLFAEGSADLDARAIAQLDEIAAALAGDLAGTTFVVEGHADARESVPGDVRLSMLRAERVRDHLVSKGGIEPARLVVKAYGSSRPAATGDDGAARAANRRIELVGVASARAPLRLEAAVLVDGPDGHLTPLAPRATLESGARYAVRFVSSETAHVYVVQEDGAGSVTRLFPNPTFGSGDNPVRAEVDHVLPGEGRLFRLDDTVGRERLYVVATRTPAHDLDDLMARAAAGDGAAGRREMVLQIRSRGVAGVVGPDDAHVAKAVTDDEDVAMTVIEFTHRRQAGARRGHRGAHEADPVPSSGADGASAGADARTPPRRTSVAVDRRDRETRLGTSLALSGRR